MRARFLLIVAAVVGLAAGSLFGGWNFKGFNINIQSVPLSPYRPIVDNRTNSVGFMDGLGQSLAGARAHADAPLSPFQLSTLEANPPFKGMTSNEIHMKFTLIRLAILDAIELIKTQDPGIADCLLKMFWQYRLCISFGGTPGVNAEIREDGSPTCGDEAINLYKFPCPTNRLALYSVEVFALLNTLAHEGQHALQAGFNGTLPPGFNPIGLVNTNEATEALTNQCREVETATAELARMDATLAVTAEINTNLQLPAGASGIAAAIGKAILNDTSLTPEQKRAKARELHAFIEGILRPAALQALECRTAYKRALMAWFAGELNPTNPIVRGIRDSGWFRTATTREFGEFRFISALVGGFLPYTNYFQRTNYGSAFADPDLYPPIVISSNVLRQIGTSIDSLTTTQRTFNVSGLKSVTGGLSWGDATWFSGDATDNVNGAIWAYEDTDNDGLLDESSGVKLLESPDFLGSPVCALNAPNMKAYLLNRTSGNLYELTGPPGGYPTGHVFRGQITTKKDILHVAFSDDFKYAFGWKDFNRPLSLGLRWNVGEYNSGLARFQPLGNHYEPFKYVETAPSIGEAPYAGSERLSITASVGVDVTACNVNGVATPLVTIKSDPAGHAIFNLPSALTAGQRIQFKDNNGMESPIYQVPPMTLPYFYLPEVLPDNNVRFEVYGSARRDYTLLCSDNLGTWVEDFTSKSSRFGGVHFIDDRSSGNVMFYRARKEPFVLKARSDVYTLPPGVRCPLYLGYNDHVRDDTIFEQVGATGFHPSLTLLSTKGVLSFAALSDISQVVLNYRLVGGGQTSATATVYVNLDENMLTNPPVFTNSLTGELIVNVPCLVFSNRHYPTYQFKLRNSPTDVCTDPHWHSPFNFQVFSLEVTNSPISDPNPPSCGYGREAEVPQEDFIATLAHWKAFLNAYPPP